VSKRIRGYTGASNLQITVALMGGKQVPGLRVNYRLLGNYSLVTAE